MDPDLDSDPLARYAPYKPKRQWPPDMTKLSPKHQFRLERKYRRRAALKFARPKWTKGTKLVQWGVIFCMFSRPLLPVSGSVPPCMIRQETNEIVTLVYAVLFMEWENGKSPFDEVSSVFLFWLLGSVGGLADGIGLSSFEKWSLQVQKERFLLLLRRRELKKTRLSCLV